MKTLLDTPRLRVRVAEPPAPAAAGDAAPPAAILCFTGIGHAIGGIDVQSEEFLRASASATALFVVDKTRSWGNHIDWAALREAVAPHIAGRTLHTLGNSMGGFLAILATRFFEVDVAVAFAPQYSVHPEQMPDEHRWDDYVQGIRRWRWPSLDGAFQARTRYYVLAGVGGADDAHLARFPVLPNLHKLWFRDPGFQHHVAQRLKQEGCLYEVIARCLQGQAPEALRDGPLGAPAWGCHLG